jgi:Ca2+/Na+ antiporter
MHGDTDVGFGLVIGSALIAFGIIPPMCYFNQKQLTDGESPAIKLTSWAICRDTFSYVAALAMVTAYMYTNSACITIYESSSLLIFYLIYIVAVVYFAGSAETKDDEAVVVSAEATPLVAKPVSKDEDEGSDDDDDDDDDDDETSCGGCWAYVTALTKPVERTSSFIYSWTMPAPAEGDQTAAGWLGSAMAFFWLALISEGIYELTVVICDLTTFLNPATLGAVILSVGAQVPDALGSMAMSRAGMGEGAVSSALSSQVITISIGFGLPWSIYLAMGNSIQLAHHTGTKIADAVLIFILMVVVVVFFSSVMLDRRGAHGGPQLSKEGSIVTVTSFWFAYLSFFAVEVLSETGYFNQFGDDDGVDDD